MSCQSAWAVDTGLRRVVEAACSLQEELCFLKIEGSSVGPLACQSNMIYWGMNQANGREMFGLLSAVMNLNKKVNLNISDDCFLPLPDYPTMIWIHIQ